VKFSTDANQKEIVRELKQRGYAVEDFAKVGGGVPDLLVAKNGVTIAVEIKRTIVGKFKIGQLEWLATWKGLCGYASTTDAIEKMFQYPTIYCFSKADKAAILEFITR
jgi:Holliday junction resolvase